MFPNYMKNGNELKAMGHREHCFMCGKMIDCAHTDPGLWGTHHFTNTDPGMLKHSHMSCVSEAIDKYIEKKNIENNKKGKKIE